MEKSVLFLRIDDRLIHGQVIVGWLPVVKPEVLLVVNKKISDDFMRQEMMSLSMPVDIELEFVSPDNISAEAVNEKTFILVTSPEDAWKCLENGIKPEIFNVGGMHSRDNKEELFEALHVDHSDRKHFNLILETGLSPIFQPTPQNEPVLLSDIL